MIDNFELFERKGKGKKHKPEKEAIEDKYKEYIDKIEDKRKELQKINFSDEPESIRHEKAVIKRTEVEMAEKELEIVKLRDKKFYHKRLLKISERKEKERKEHSKR